MSIATTPCNRYLSNRKRSWSTDVWCVYCSKNFGPMLLVLPMLINYIVRQQRTGRCIGVQTKFVQCFGYFSMSVARIQLMPLCHHWGFCFIDKNKMAAMRNIYFLYIHMCDSYRCDFGGCALVFIIHKLN